MTDPNVDAETTAPPDDSVPFAGLDIEIGPLAYGTARLGEATLDAAIDRIEAAVDAGMTLIETADVAGFDPTEEDAAHGGGFGAAEQRLGEVFAEVPELRDRVVLSTKGGVFPPLPFDTSADHLRQACDASLYRLGVDVIDLYQVHQPDLLAHPGEVAEVLTELREAGKVREVGVCNHTAWQTQALSRSSTCSCRCRFRAVRLGRSPTGPSIWQWNSGSPRLRRSAREQLPRRGDQQKLQAVAAVFDRIAAEQGAPQWRSCCLVAPPRREAPIVSTSRVAPDPVSAPRPPRWGSRANSGTRYSLRRGVNPCSDRYSHHLV